MRKYKIPVNKTVWLFQKDAGTNFSTRTDGLQFRTKLEVVYTEDEIYDSPETNSIYWMLFKLPSNNKNYNFLLANKNDIIILD